MAIPPSLWGRSARALTPLCLTLLALLLRLKGLQDWPAWTDETGEIGTAVDIAFHGARPLVHNDSYRGPLWAWLLAVPLRLLGPHAWLPRVFAATLGALTVGAVWLLAARLAGRRAALAAALLATTAFAPLVFFSHIAWSNHLTPLAVALALWTTAWAMGWPEPVRPDRPNDAVGPDATNRGWSAGPMALAGLAWGAALQTHPSALLAFAGLAGWLFWRWRGRWRGRPDHHHGFSLPNDRVLLRACLAAAVGMTAALSPVLVYNARAMIGGDRPTSVAEATAEDQPVNRDLSPRLYLDNVIGLFGQLGRAAAAGPPWERGDPQPRGVTVLTDRLRPEVTVVACALLLAALARAALRPDLALVAWPAWATVLLLPLINRSYLNIYDARYLGVLLLLGQVALGVWLAEAVEGKPTSLSAAGADMASGVGRTGPRRPRGAGARFLLLLLFLFLTLYPLLAANAYAQRAYDGGRVNQALWSALDALLRDRQDRADAPPVLIARELRELDLGGGGDPARALSLMLTLEGQAVETVRADTLGWHLAQSPGPLWVVVSDGAVWPEPWHPQRLAWGPGWQLRPGWQALRLERAGPASGIGSASPPDGR